MQSCLLIGNIKNGEVGHEKALPYTVGSDCDTTTLIFLPFFCCFCVVQGIPCNFQCFPSFSKDFRGAEETENPCFLVVFLVFSRKSKEIIPGYYNSLCVPDDDLQIVGADLSLPGNQRIIADEHCRCRSRF